MRSRNSKPEDAFPGATASGSEVGPLGSQSLPLPWPAWSVEAPLQFHPPSVIKAAMCPLQEEGHLFPPTLLVAPVAI